MQRSSLFLFLLLISGLAHAQYWFGPKVGANRNDFKYQNPAYTEDSVRVGPDYNFELGGVLIYQATDMFSVQGEINYERMERTLNDKPAYRQDIFSHSTYHFLSVPMLFRVSFGREPIHYYIDGGIKLKFWMGGKGRIVSSEESEFGDPPKDFDKIVFKQSKSNIENGVYAVREANVMQFGLAVGGGMYFDLVTNGRLLVDLKYVFGHSNMGFNDNPDFSDPVSKYVERFTYRSNTLSVSVAYLFEFDAQLQRKGKSTISRSNKSKHR